MTPMVNGGGEKNRLGKETEGETLQTKSSESKTRAKAT
jgi:hypothetical protein